MQFIKGLFNGLLVYRIQQKIKLKELKPHNERNDVGS